MANLDCLDGDLARAGYSHVGALRAAAGADVMLSGTILETHARPWAGTWASRTLVPSL